MSDFKGFLGVDEVRKVMHAARQVSRETLTSMLDEVEEYIQGHQKVL